MRKFDFALDKDINKQYNDAALYYQQSIDEGNINIEGYLNLAFLYWIFQDFGFSNYFNISDELVDIGCQKYPEILRKGIQQFPNNLELHFWERYFQHIFYGEEFSENDCNNLLKEYGDDDSKSIVPYFFLYLFDKEKYKEKRSELLDMCNEQPTAKNIYIKSIIEKQQ